jgi:hypothetical protein
MRRNRFTEAISDPTKNFLAFFLVGTLLFTIVSDGVASLFWDTLGAWLAARSPLDATVFKAIVTFGLMGVLLGLTYFTDIARWLRSRLPWLSPLAEQEPEANVAPLTQTYRGLIVAMSARDDAPAEAAIRFHWNGGQPGHLEHCWLICTEKSLPYARNLAAQLAQEGIDQTLRLHYGAYRMADADRPQHTLSLLVPDDQVDDPHYLQNLVNSIYEDAIARANLSESEIIADYTGATKGMTAGILLACTHPDRPLQYISQIRMGPDQRPEFMSINISYRLKPLRPSRRPAARARRQR